MSSYPPSPDSDSRGPHEQLDYAQPDEQAAGYPHAAGFPQPDFPPTQPVYPSALPDYPPTIYAPVQPAYPVAQESKKNRNALWIALTSIALLLLLSGGGAYYFLQIRSTPEKTLQTYCSAIKNEDGQALYDTYSSEARSQTDGARLQQGLRLIEFLSGGIEDCSVDGNSVREDGTLAEGRVTFTLDSGHASSATIHLIEENGQWRVENNALFP